MLRPGSLLLLLLPILGLLSASLHAADPSPSPRVFTENGTPADPNFFPLAVWLQSPRNAPRYKAAGINLYVGLYNGPTAADLAELQKAGMPVICDQNAVGLENKDNPIIAGWMHGDEPDNAQSLGKSKGYGPPIAPSKIIEDYAHIRAADPSRPVRLNLGQGVAWDGYYGRGVRTNHPEDYAEYAKGGDIVSFDIYPAVHESPQVAGKLEFVPRGVARLVDWTHGEKSIWNCIECTHIGNPKVRATPAQVRSEVWMSLIRGSRGLIYFAHQFAPSFKEAAVLDDPEMLSAITAINQQIHELAPVLNSPTIADGLTLESPDGAIVAMLKHTSSANYVFAANLRNEAVHGSFSLHRTPAAKEVKVLGETRNLTAHDDKFADDFPAYGVHLYEIR